MLSISAKSDTIIKADPEDLLGMSTAYLAMEAGLRLDSADEVILCFSSADSTGFADTVDTVKGTLTAGSEGTGTGLSRHTNGHGYSWVAFTDDDFEDLITSVHLAAGESIERGYGLCLLAALFGLERDGDHVYWICSFYRRAYHPFAPQGTSTQNQSLRSKPEPILGGELEIEGNEGY